MAKTSKDAQSAPLLIKLTLESGKTVTVRQKKIKDELNLVKELGKNGESGAAFSMTLAIELIKLLIQKIDGKPVNRAQLEDLDSVFTEREFKQLVMHYQQEGGEVLGPPKVAFENDESSG